MRLDEYLPPALTRFLREEEGTSFTEYALVVSLIAVVCVIALLALGKGI
ncbi:Flp family type IVb pilin [Undibacterium arcticum]|uniref:Flp family type IVb pilin n=1 Tax=Undibacterium arcticum TaxID=1762892 RepID=A0ABV7F3F8_9BURK